MVIQAYRVESRRPGLADGIPLTPVLVGTVQFTGGIDINELPPFPRSVCPALVCRKSVVGRRSPISVTCPRELSKLNLEVEPKIRVNLARKLKTREMKE